jgi:hypothetical protein
MFGKTVRILVDAYVEAMRNTPFIVQLFIVYFGLPLVGLRMSNIEAGLLAMVLNLAAYSIRDHPRRNRRHPQVAGRGRGLARDDPGAGLPARGAACPRSPRSWPAHIQPVCPDAARLEHRVLHLRRGAVGRRGGDH